jgi:hypothetical protein
MNQWSIEELRLWNAMHSPVTKKITLHSFSPEKRKSKEGKELLERIEKQKKREFLDGWAFYNRWITH